jgi:hypothetical protein
MKASRADPGRRYLNMGEVLEEIRPLATKTISAGRRVSLERQKMTNIFLMYREADQQALTQLMEEFSAKAAELGIVLRVSDLHDL